MTKEEFINLNRNVPADTLRLKFHGKDYPWLEEAITHIECLAKAGKKFISDNGSVLPDMLVSPLSLEQATSAAIAEFHASLVNKGDRVLDLTMGLGIDSRAIALGGASKVVACEINSALAEASIRNYSSIENLEVINTDSVEYLKSLPDNSFDIIFADPARRGKQGERLYNLHDCIPDLIELYPEIIRTAPRMLAKLSPMLDITQTLNDLPDIHTLYIVDDGKECKELLADVRRETRFPPMIYVRSSDKVFAFTKDDEAGKEMRYAVPETGDIIYEPSPAMMKAAPFKLISNIAAGTLADNTHLYVSDHPLELAGRQMHIEAIYPLNSAGIKEISKKYSQLNLAVRNFPMTVKELLKKLKIKEGGNRRGIAVTLLGGQHCLIIGEPLK